MKIKDAAGLNEHVHPVFADILNRFAMTPANLAQLEAEAIDRAMLADKQRDGYAQREQARAMRLQNQFGAF